MKVVIKMFGYEPQKTEVQLEDGTLLEGVKCIDISQCYGEFPEAILTVIPKEVTYEGWVETIEAAMPKDDDDGRTNEEGQRQVNDS
jgi:hypothetical protein